MRVLRGVVVGVLLLTGLALLPIDAVEATEAPLAPAWVNQANSTTRSQVHGLAVAPNGDVITVGWFEDQATFGAGPSAVTLHSAGGSEAFVTRTRPDGTLVWARAAGGVYWDQADGVAIDAAGTIYVWGHFSGTMTFRGSTPPLPLDGGDTYNNGDGFVARYDADGVPQWARHVGGAIYDGFDAGAVDPAGNIVLHAFVTVSSSWPKPTIDTGIGSETQSLDGPVLVRYDPSGTLTTIAPNHEFFYTRELISRTDGTFLLGGERAAVPPGEPGSPGSAAVAEISPDLTVTAMHIVAGGTGVATLNGMALDAQGNLIVGGRIDRHASIGGGPPMTADYNGYVASFAPNWSLRWADTQSTVVFNVAVGAGDRVLIDTFFNPSAYPPPTISATFGGPDGITLTSAGGMAGTGIALAEYEADGTIRSAQVIRNDTHAFPGPIATSGAHAYVSGSAEGPATFGLGADAITTPTPPAGTQSLGFVAKFTGRSTSQLADLRTDIDVAPQVFATGSTATLTARVRNTGPDTSTNTRAVLSLTSGLTLIAANPGTGSMSGSTWLIGALPRDQVATIVLTLGEGPSYSGGTLTLTAASDAIEISTGEEQATSFVGFDDDGEVSTDLGWVHRSNSSTTVQTRAAPTPNGGAITASVASGYIDEGVGADSQRVGSPGDHSYWMAVTQNDATGTVQFVRSIEFEAPPYNPPLPTVGGVGADANGNVYVAGILATTARIDRGDGTTQTLAAAPGLDPGVRPAFLASWSATGSFRFAIIAISAVVPTTGLGLQVLADGTTYLGATLFFSGSTSFGSGPGALRPPAPSMVVGASIGAFDSNGQPLWVRLLRGQPDDTTAFRAMAADTGGVTLAAVLTTGSSTPVFASDVVVADLAPGGQVGPTTYLFPSHNFVTVVALARGPAGRVGLVGAYSGTLTVNGLAPLPDTNNVGSNGYALVLGTSHTPQWSTALAGTGKERLDAVTFDPAGRLVVGGGAPGLSRIAETTATTPTGGGLVAVLADDHTVIRAHQVAPATWNATGIDSVAIEPNGDLLVAGLHSANATLGTPPTRLRLPGAFAATITASAVPRGRIDTQVIDVNAQQVEGAVVTVMANWPSWMVVATGVTDATGRVSLDVVAGDYRVRVYDPRGRFDRIWYTNSSTFKHASVVRVLAGQPTGVGVIAPAHTGGALHGTVADGSSAPLPNVWVQVLNANGYVAGAITDASGAYRVDALAQGTYYVRFIDLSHARASRWWRGSLTKAGAEPILMIPGGVAANMTLP